MDSGAFRRYRRTSGAALLSSAPVTPSPPETLRSTRALALAPGLRYLYGSNVRDSVAQNIRSQVAAS